MPSPLQVIKLVIHEAQNILYMSLKIAQIRGQILSRVQISHLRIWKSWYSEYHINLRLGNVADLIHVFVQKTISKKQHGLTDSTIPFSYYLHVLFLVSL